jgi:hypothetical protein
VSGVSVQKVSAAMRKAGLAAAKWHPSGQVRGWGSWSPGVRTHKDGDAVLVCMQHGHHTLETGAIRASDRKRISAALDAAGLVYEFNKYNVAIVTGAKE